MVIPTGAVYFGLSPLVGEAKSFAVAVVIAVFYVIISRSWDKRGDLRFWLIIGLFATAHIAALFLITFPHLKSGLVVLPVALVDGLAMWGIMNWIEKRFPRSSSVEQA
jgi:hypothetical protein